MKFCVQVTHSANLKHKFRNPHEDNLSSYESYKVITLKARGTMHAQYFFIARMFENDRSMTLF